jgi:predicted XRE-type DNA-binding protein
MMTEERWPTLEETEAEDKAAGRIDEAEVARHRAQMRHAQRAYKLAEVRKSLGLTQTDVAAAMCVSQRRVSAVERGDISRISLGIVATYVAALGGHIEIVASFGDERIVIGSPGPAIHPAPADPAQGRAADPCLLDVWA